MKAIVKIQTQDGKLHDTVEQARHHADVTYTNAVSVLAGQLVHLEKYQAVKTFIDENLSSFVALQILKNDMEMETHGMQGTCGFGSRED